MESRWSKIHQAVLDSGWAHYVEDWEEDEQAKHVAYSLFDGTTLIVYEDGRCERHFKNGKIVVTTLNAEENIE